VGAIYLKGRPPGAPPCATNALATAPDAPRYHEFGLLHELFHALGAVASCAPHHTQAGHVLDAPTDLMYAGPLPWRPAALDVGRDDYFAHGNADCLDLARSAFLEPPAPDAVLPPSWPAALPLAAPQDCGAEPDLPSREATIRTTLEFVSAINEPLTLYWLDYQAQRRPYGTLPPLGRRTFDTFASHPWLLAAADGGCVAVFVAGASPARAILGAAR
jgi:hypothetical protein